MFLLCVRGHGPDSLFSIYLNDNPHPLNPLIQILLVWLLEAETISAHVSDYKTLSPNSLFLSNNQHPMLISDIYHITHAYSAISIESIYLFCYYDSVCRLTADLMTACDSGLKSTPQLFTNVGCSLPLLLLGSFQSGDIEIMNNTTKDLCRLKFSPYSYFSRDAPRKVCTPCSFFWQGEN